MATEYPESRDVIAVLGPRPTDEAIGDYARTHGFVIVTKDEDFQRFRVWRSGLLPAKSAADALHIAIAAANGIDYLLTWNIRHLANAMMRRRIEAACRAAGLAAPVLCTPEELMEG